jgi:hypothetical protein
MSKLRYRYASYVASVKLCLKRATTSLKLGYVEASYPILELETCTVSGLETLERLHGAC